MMREEGLSDDITQPDSTENAASEVTPCTLAHTHAHTHHARILHVLLVSSASEADYGVCVCRTYLTSINEAAEQGLSLAGMQL